MRPFGTKGRTNDGILLKKEKGKDLSFRANFCLKINLRSQVVDFVGELPFIVAPVTKWNVVEWLVLQDFHAFSFVCLLKIMREKF